MPTIAWQYMPGQIAGWASKTYVQQCDVYSQITSVPIGCIFFAGDTYSQTPGWQVGAIDSARLAVRAFAEGLHSSDPALYGSDEVLTCP